MDVCPVFDVHAHSHGGVANRAIGNADVVKVGLGFRSQLDGRGNRLQGAVADDDVLAGRVAPGLETDAVVARGDVAIGDVNVAARNDIDPVGDGAKVIVDDARTLDEDLFASKKVECPASTVAKRNVADRYVPAALQEQCADLERGHLVACAGPAEQVPPARSVDHTVALDNDLLLIFRHKEIVDHLHATADMGTSDIILLSWTCPQGGAVLQPKGHVTPEADHSGQVVAGRKADDPASLAVALIDRRLYESRVVGLLVASGTEIADVESRGRNDRFPE